MLKNFDHRAAEAHHRAATPATTATETARPMVSSRLARERQLLHPLKAPAVGLLAGPVLSSDWQRRTNIWRGETSLTRGHSARGERSSRVYSMWVTHLGCDNQPLIQLPSP